MSKQECDQPTKRGADWLPFFISDKEYQMTIIVTVKVDSPMKLSWKYYAADEDIAEQYIAQCRDTYKVADITTEESKKTVKQLLADNW